MGLFDKIFRGKDEEPQSAEAEPSSATEPSGPKPANEGASAGRRDPSADDPASQPTSPEAAAGPARALSASAAGSLAKTPDNDAVKQERRKQEAAPESRAETRAPSPAPRAPEPKPTQAVPASNPTANATSPQPTPKPAKRRVTSTASYAAVPRPSPAPSAAKPVASRTATTKAAAPQASARAQAADAKKPAPQATGGSKSAARKQSATPANPPVAAPPKPDRATQLATLRARTRRELGHIEQFAFDLELSCAPVGWASSCQAPVRALAEAARELELGDVQAAADRLVSALERLSATANGTLNAEAQKAALEAYAKLVESLPNMLRPAPAAKEREPLVLDSLLRQVEGVHALTLDKLEKAGVLSLRAIATRPAADLAERAGLDLAVAERIVEQVAEVVSGHGASAAGELRELLETRAKRAFAELEQAHERFVQAEQADDGKGKRDARRDRDAALSVLASLFARLGELPKAHELSRGSLPQRIERARSLVSQWS